MRGICSTVASAAALVLISIAVAVQVAHAETLSRRWLLDVELVCRNATPTAPTVFGSSTVSAFRASVQGLRSSGKTSMAFPVSVERILDGDHVWTLYNSLNDKVTVSDRNGCVRTEGPQGTADDVVLMQTITNLLWTMTSLPVYSTKATVRGMEVATSSQDALLAIPTAFGGLGATQSSYFTTFSASLLPWTVNFMEVNVTPVSIEATTATETVVNNCLFSFSFFGVNVSDALTPLPSTFCTDDSTRPLARPSIARQTAVHPLAASASSSSSLLSSSSLALSSSSTSTASLSKSSAQASHHGSSPVSSASSSSSSSSSSSAHKPVVGSSGRSSFSSSSSSSSSPAGDAVTQYTMPEFPDTFTANFLVISPSQHSVFQVREVFSSDYGLSRTKMQFPMRGIGGRVYEYEWYTNRWYQVAMYHTKFAVPSGEEIIDQALREYFFPDQEKCMSVMIGYGLFAENGRSLLLLAPDTTPTFVGNQTVRNIPCGVWTAEVNGARVSWYWANTDLVNTKSFESNNSWWWYTPPTPARLVRMTVTNQGGPPPLFPHHPFFPQGYAFPAADRTTACEALSPGDLNMGCNSNLPNTANTYIYEITSFVSYIRGDDHDIPEACSDLKLSGSIPSFQCDYTGVTGGVAAVLMVVVAIVFCLMSGCCVWCRFSRMVRRQQEELVRLAQEIRAGQSTDVRDTTSAHDGKNPAL
ncbi:Enriched in surface-labeled proteome protein 9 [Novymonas esmeraldas]|uniref:Enriched in surface-labeled proteome protein 9 n=1 Tax=Novymonas esmeraldas TaxID=1808958 RepID=A0AAW0EUP7_9TRYP